MAQFLWLPAPATDQFSRRFAVIAGIARQGGFEKTKALIAEYLERAKASLAPIGNAPARAEFIAVADALLAG